MKNSKDIINYINKIPKSELHLHIEGSLEPELMFKLSKRNKVEIPFKSVEEIKSAYNFTNLDSFLKICETGNLKMVFWILKESKILISKLKKYCSLSPNYDDINHFMYICFEKFVFSRRQQNHINFQN